MLTEGPPPVSTEDLQSSLQLAALEDQGLRGFSAVLTVVHGPPRYTCWGPGRKRGAAGLPRQGSWGNTQMVTGKESGDRFATRTHRTAFVRPASQRSQAAAEVIHLSWFTLD